jgi:HAD superfamily hydrolase (TIGR01549 family)
MKPHLLYIRAVLFDLDGTLTRPDALDLSKLKQAIGCPKNEYILEFIRKIPSPADRRKAMAELNQFEMQAAEKAKPNEGAEDLLQYLRLKDIRMGILTRNSSASTQRALRNFNKTSAGDFDLIITRDEPIKPKPSGDGIRMAAERLNVPISEVLMIGDFIIDIEAGTRAGAITALLNNPRLPVPADTPCDFRIEHLREVKDIVRMGLPLPGGKLPNDLLHQFLNQFGFEDPSVLIKPGVGEDTAAVDVHEDEVLLLKSDPITFATDAIGRYAVLVNANDIATAGATPRWFLSTLMFPVGTSAFSVQRVMAELSRVCRQYGITLCGGHTEITDAVSRPMVTGTMAGTITRDRLIHKQNIKPGDRILLTKGVAVEGTAIIAREFKERLKQLGVAEGVIAECRRFLDHISVLKEAAIAGDVEGVSAMHDVTEGGLATALEELSIAGGYRFRIAMEKIPIYRETARICGLLKLDPLGLIGSGSLIICCRRYSSEILQEKLAAAKIPVAVIGEVREAGRGVEAVRNRQPSPWPRFEVDEITRLF